MAPQYSASPDNVQKLKDAGAYKVKVGEFAFGTNPDSANLISVRGSTLASPYQNSYAKYVAEAIKQELSIANMHATNAEVEVSGVLVKNVMEASGFSTSYAEIETRFIVKKGQQIRYDQVKSARHEWPSAFAGAIAIPRAVQEYPNLVQKLLASLYADRAFTEALK